MRGGKRGERARVSLATALLGRPELLVLDEPTVGLDPVLLGRTSGGCSTRLRVEGTTLLVSSHVIDEAAECDRLLLMRYGTLLDATTPDALRRRTGERDLSRAFLAVIEDRRDEPAHHARDRPARPVADPARPAHGRAADRGAVHALLVLLRYVFDGRPAVFEQIGAPLCGLFPFIVMFLVTSITMLRERTSGTLERLTTLPLAKLDLLAGYAVAFGVLRGLQTLAVCLVGFTVLAVCLVGFTVLGLGAPHGVALVALLSVANALLGMSLGLFVSAFARHGVPGCPVHAGADLPAAAVARALRRPRRDGTGCWRRPSGALPLTYAYDALARATDPQALGTRFAVDVVVVTAAALAALALGALTLRRRTA